MKKSESDDFGLVLVLTTSFIILISLMSAIGYFVMHDKIKSKPQIVHQL